MDAVVNVALTREGNILSKISAADKRDIVLASPGSSQLNDVVNSPRTRLVLLGTSGGPPWWGAKVGRSGISSAVSVDGSVYLVDCGEGWGPRYQQASLGPEGYQECLANMRAVFITHMHSDHTVDYPNLLTLAWHNGSDGFERPVKVLGPGDRGALPPVIGGESQAQVTCPEDPTPGIETMTERLIQGFAADINDRVRDQGKTDIRSLFDVHDISLPKGCGDNPNGNPSPTMDPFPVYEDDKVRVTATLVNHTPVFPSFAFRFDSDYGSIVFSGDTCPCDNLVSLAKGADILVHEAIDQQWAESIFPKPLNSADAALLQHFLKAHTTIEQVGPVAEKCGVRALVLSHIGPADTPVSRWKEAQNGFSGQLVVGEDLLQIGL